MSMEDYPKSVVPKPLPQPVEKYLASSLGRLAKWPDVVPILDPNDIYQGNYDGPEDTHCFAGWVRLTFSIYAAEVMYRMASDRLSEPHSLRSVVSWNDSELTSPAMIAQLWNELVRELGYTQIVDR